MEIRNGMVIAVSIGLYIDDIPSSNADIDGYLEDIPGVSMDIDNIIKLFGQNSLLNYDITKIKSVCL